MSDSKARLYAELAEQLAALIAGEPELVANAANMAALIYHGLPDLNWAGFYFAQAEKVLVISGGRVVVENRRATIFQDRPQVRPAPKPGGATELSASVPPPSAPR